MRITILEAGRAPGRLGEEYPRYPDMFVSLLSKADQTLVFDSVALIDGEALPDVSRCEAAIITGSPAGDKAINCGKDCGAKYAAGTVVTLAAVPLAGKAFLGWTDACLAAGTNLTCTVTMNAGKTAKGNFAR